MNQNEQNYREANTHNAPAAPEKLPPDVRKELHQENMSYQGEPVAPSKNKDDNQSYMGAMDENVTPIMPPLTGSADVTHGESEEEKKDDGVEPHKELTPG